MRAVLLASQPFSRRKTVTDEQPGQALGHDKTFNIIVNGRPREVTGHKLTYQQVVRIAFPDDQPDPNVVYTVAYANPHGKDGTLVDGEDVPVKEGMIFNVTKTNRS
jgi:hypothetical protein